MSTWREDIELEMSSRQDAWANIEYSKPSVSDSDFYDQDGVLTGYSEGFIVYTPAWIYFGCTYDGGYWVESVPRHPRGRLGPRDRG